MVTERMTKPESVAMTEPGTLPEGLPLCELCGYPMPAGEEMFKYHGFSGPCPKAQRVPAEELPDDRVRDAAPTGGPS